MKHYLYRHAFNRIQAVTTPGNAPINEDAKSVSDFCITVADGATGLHPELFVMGNRPMAVRSDAEWLAKCVAYNLSSALNHSSIDKENVDVERELVKVLSITEQEYWEHAEKRDMVDAIRTAGESCFPSAAFITAFFNADDLVIAWAGDCMGIVKKTTGEYEVVGGDHRLKELEAESLSFIESISKDRGISFLEALQTLDAKNKLIETRCHMNSGDGDGYSVATFHNKENIMLGESRIAVEDVEGVIIMSDGLYQLVDTFDRYTPAELYDLIMKQSLISAEKELRALQSSDPKCNAFHRYKVGDDATAIAACVR